MSFEPDQLPHPEDYYRDCGLRLAGTGKWRATCCNFCEYRALRVNVKTGAYVCTDCGASGADVLDHRMAVHDESVEQAAKALGAWVDDGKAAPPRPTPLSPRAALSVLKFEAVVVAIAAGNVAQGVNLSSLDRGRLLQAAGRIGRVAEIFD